MNITGSIVALRALEPSDVDRLYLWENDPEVWQFGDRRAPLSRHQLWEYATTYDADPIRAGQIRFMITLSATGEVVGAIDLFDIEATSGRGQVGILVGKDYRGRGYGASALGMLCSYAATQLGLHQLWSITSAMNAAARATFERCGFKISGRLRSWQKTGARYEDAYIYQLLF